MFEVYLQEFGFLFSTISVDNRQGDFQVWTLHIGEFLLEDVECLQEGCLSIDPRSLKVYILARVIFEVEQTWPEFEHRNKVNVPFGRYIINFFESPCVL